MGQVMLRCKEDFQRENCGRAIALHSLDVGKSGPQAARPPGRSPGRDCPESIHDSSGPTFAMLSHGISVLSGVSHVGRFPFSKQRPKRCCLVTPNRESDTSEAETSSGQRCISFYRSDNGRPRKRRVDFQECRCVYENLTNN
jgi:hypothetical protein